VVYVCASIYIGTWLKWRITLFGKGRINEEREELVPGIAPHDERDFIFIIIITSLSCVYKRKPDLYWQYCFRNVLLCIYSLLNSRKSGSKMNNKSKNVTYKMLWLSGRLHRV